MFENINIVIGILAIYGAWYGAYRYFAFYSADHLQAHEALNREILDEATECSQVAVKYVELDGYTLTPLGHCADQHEIETYQERLRTLRDKIQLGLLESPDPWRLRIAARWKFYGNIRQWLEIRGVCDNIVHTLSDDRRTTEMFH